MFFLNLTYLWGFLGLAVPIAIHLWSKKEGRTIMVGSLKLFREADSKKSSTIKINEWWLLLLRLLAISLLVLIMAEPQVKREVNISPIIYLVEPSLLSHDEIRSVIDSIEPGASVQLLQKGFPELEMDELEADNSGTPNYWQLAKEMEGLATDSIVVFTNAFLSGVKGMRPNINKNINWIVLDPGDSEKVTVEALKKENEVHITSVVSDHQRLTYEKEIVPVSSSRLQINSANDSLLVDYEDQEWIPLKTEDPLNVLIFYDDSLKNDRRYIESSFDAIGKFLKRPVEVQAVQEMDSLKTDVFQMLVWLSRKQVLETPATILLYKPDSLAQELIEAGSSENLFHLTKSLNVDIVTEEHLPEHLLELLDLHQGLEEKIEFHDRRVMAREELLPVSSSIENNKDFSEIQGLNKWLWLLLLPILLAERILARHRKQ